MPNSDHLFLHKGEERNKKEPKRRKGIAGRTPAEEERGGEHAVSPRTEPGNIAKSVYLACLDVGNIKPRARSFVSSRDDLGSESSLFLLFAILSVCVCTFFTAFGDFRDVERAPGPYHVRISHFAD